MKKFISIILLSCLFIVSSLFIVNSAEAKGYRNYKSGGQLKHQGGYFKPSSGKWIEGHFKTGPDNYKWNNRKNLYGW